MASTDRPRTPDTRPGRPVAEAGVVVAIVLAMLTTFGPVAMDLYLPVLPALAQEIGATASGAQLTMTACLFGLAIGQLVVGPLSDRYGRRVPLLIGVVVFTLVSVLCAFSGSIAVLVVLRLVQGLAGGVGLVIAHAAGRDLYEGARLTRYYGRVVVLSGLAAILAPVLGGQMAAVLDWRGFFLVLGGIGLVILMAVLFGFRETLPAAARVPGGLAHTRTSAALVLRDRMFVGATLGSSLTSAAYFAYLGGASFVLQEVYGLTPAGYSLAFGANAAGFALFGFLAGRAVEWWSPHRVFKGGLGVIAAGAFLFLIVALARLPLPVAIIAFFAIAAGAAAVSPPSTTLALEKYPHIAGTAASLLGVARFAAGGIAAPLAGIGGAQAMMPLAVVAVVSVLGALVTYLLLMRGATGTATATG